MGGVSQFWMVGRLSLASYINHSHNFHDVMQVVTGCCDGGSFMNNAQHITMCALFLCNGFADLAVSIIAHPSHRPQLEVGARTFCIILQLLHQSVI